MKDMGKTCFALVAVALMAFSSVALAGDDTDASGSMGPMAPEPKQYMYAITTDSNNVNITKVRASENGSALTVVSGPRTSGGVSNISYFWNFDKTTGMGPFNSFYAAINITEGSGYDNGEQMLNPAIGTIAFILDPYDLSKTLNGTKFEGTYNIMLVIPTVYWKATSTCLYLSNSPSYNAGGSTVRGMTAYAHTATFGSVSKVYPYIAIGVYEASVSDGKMLSVSGATPKASITNDTFKSYADALIPASGSDYQQWNFYQWTLYKMMAYTVMGTKNSQAMLGDGPVSGYSASETGLADAKGPYANSTSTYSKLLIENSWGSLWEFVGDACFYDRTLYAGGVLGGRTISGHPQSKIFGATLPSSGYIGATYSSSTYWDLPRSTGGSSSGFSNPGGYVWSNSGWSSLVVVGCRGTGSNAGVSALGGADSLSLSSSGFGSRLAYVMSADAAAATFEESGLRYRTLSGDAASLVGYTGSPVNVSVPSTVTYGGREFAVVSVGEKAFYGCKTLKTLDLGSVESIELKAFANCTKLGTIDMGDSLEEIGPYAFYGCSPIDVSFPSSLMTVPASAFNKVVFYDVYGRELSAAAGLAGNEFLKIDDSGRLYGADFTIGGVDYRLSAASPLNPSIVGAVDGADKLTISSTIVTPVLRFEIASIPAYVFEGCATVESVTISGPIEVGELAFQSCPSLKEVVLSDGVVSVGPQSFSLCTLLSSVFIDEGLSSIGAYAFNGCISLEQVTFPSSLESVGNNAFRGLKFVDVDGTTVISQTASGLAGHTFAGGSRVLALVGEGTEFEVDSIQYRALSETEVAVVGSVGGFAIPSSVDYHGAVLSVVKISDGAFPEAPSVLAIPSSVTAIESGAFSFSFAWIDGAPISTEASVLAGHSYTLSGDVMMMDPEEGMAFTSEGIIYRIASIEKSQASVAGHVGSLVSVVLSLTVSVGISTFDVVSVEDDAFRSCDSLKSVDLGFVTEVGSNAFAECLSLEDVDLGDSLVTLKPYAFANCTAMSSLSIPSKLKTIGAYAFLDVILLDSDGTTVLAQTAAVLRGYTYEGDGGILERVVEAGQKFVVSGLSYTVVSVDPLQASLTGYESVPSALVIPSSVESKGRTYDVVSVGDKAFYSCASLTSVDLGSVQVVGTKAFANCTKVKTLAVPESVSEFKAYAFYGCKALKTLVIPGEDVVVSTSAFSACIGLTSASFTGSGASIGTNAFYKCYSMTSLDLSGVSEIGFKAFPYCNGMRNLIVSGTISNVGDYAFYSCEALSSVIIEDGVVSLGKSAFSGCKAISSLDVGYDLESVGANAFYRYTFHDMDGNVLSPTADNLRGHVFTGSSMVLNMLF